VISSAHDDDGERDVVIAILAGDAKPRHVTNRDLGDILNLHWNAVHLREYDIFNVVNAPALRQIAVAAAVEQADAADIDRLLTDGDLATADIDIGCLQLMLGGMEGLIAQGVFTAPGK
jgi:hypothetical protein